MSEIEKIIINSAWAQRFLEFRGQRPLLLRGPKGSGKKEVLLAFAKKFFCESSMSCGACSSCKLMASGNHPDLWQNTVNEKLTIDDIRDAMNRLSKTSFYGRGKIVLISDCERISEGAQQALLKTLEELPPNSTVLLSSSILAGVIETVVSRCVVVESGKVQDRDLINALLEDFELSEDEAELLTYFSSGLAAFARDIASKEIDWFLLVLDNLKNLRGAGPTEIFEIASKFAEDDPHQFILILMKYQRISALVENKIIDTQSLPKLLRDRFVYGNERNDVNAFSEKMIRSSDGYFELSHGQPKNVLSSILLREIS